MARAVCNGLAGPERCWELLCHTLLLDPELESLLLLHDLGAVLMNTLTVTMRNSPRL